MRFTPDRFIVVNPGGLYGISVDRLGIDQLTSARNLSLVRICQYVRLRDRTVIEAMASGIPRVRKAAEDADLPAPDFHDQGIRFTAIVHRRHAIQLEQVSTLTMSESRVLGLLEVGPRRATDLAAELGISPQAVRRTLGALRAANLVHRAGVEYSKA